MSDHRNVELKVRYGSLLGALQMLTYLGQHLPQCKEAIEELGKEVYKKVDAELDGIIEETFASGWLDDEPKLEQIVEDDYLQKLFPVSDGE